MMIETRELTKHYGAVRALVDLTLEVRPGEVVARAGGSSAQVRGPSGSQMLESPAREATSVGRACGRKRE